MKSVLPILWLSLCAGSALAQSPSEEFDRRIPSGRAPPGLQLGGASNAPADSAKGNPQVRVIDVGRRAPRAGPGPGVDETEAGYQERRIQEQNAWTRRTYSPTPPPTVSCSGTPPVCSSR